MATKDPAAPGFKQRAKDEFKEYLLITAYLMFFFAALSMYSMLLLRKYDISYLNYGFAIINALVIAKVILIGEMAHMGRRYEAKPLYQSVLYKAVVFSLLVFAFHLVEDYVKRLIRHEPFGTALHNLNYDDVMARSIVVFWTFLPLFAFRELRRVLGEGSLYALFFKPREDAGG
jgi:hypothetical protein